MTRPTKAQRLKALATYSVLASRARAVLGQTKLSTRTINALAKAAALSAMAKGSVLSVAVKASVLVTGAKTGRFFTLLNLDEQVSAADIRRFSVSKLLTNEAHAVDRAIAEVSKALADNTVVSDFSARSVGKARGDLAIVFDTHTAELGKTLQTSANALEQAVYDLSTGRADAAVVGDVTALTPNKGVADLAALADTLDRTVAFVRFFSDVADATDEINASLLTDDGEVFFLDKRLLDTAATAEQMAFDTHKVLSDAVESSDFVAVAPSGITTDVAPTADSTVAEVGLGKADAVGTAETTTFDQGLAKADTALTDTALAQHFYKVLFDTIATSDTLSLFLEAFRSSGVVTAEDVQVVRIAAGGVPPQNEHQTVADLYQSTLSKFFFETLAVTDDLDGTTTTEDDQTTELGKNIVQPVTTSELRSVDLARTLQESVGANSSGLLAMTDYCDSTYFSQAYVGTERNFS